MSYLIRIYNVWHLFWSLIETPIWNNGSEHRVFSKYFLEEAWAEFEAAKMDTADITVFTIIMYSDRQAWANSVDLDEIPLNAASHQGIHCSQISQQFLDTTTDSKLHLFKF